MHIVPSRLRMPGVAFSRMKLLNGVLSLTAIALLLAGISFSWTDLLIKIGVPLRELSNPWVRGDLVTLRGVCVLFAMVLLISRVVLWINPQVVTGLFEKIERSKSTAASLAFFIPLSLAALVLSKTILQVILYLFGYAAYGADDFSRSLSADYWLYYRRFDLGWEGWLGLGGSGWLPFSDYLFGLALALHRDLYLTPKMVNLVISALAVIATYLLGRELFGRTVGFITAALFAFQPWHLWLGISGMTSDLPSVALITLFGVFLVRWLRTDAPRALLAAAGTLGIANGFRYENWFFAAVFSLFVVFVAISRWKAGSLTRRWVTVALFALTMINVFPVVWMLASYFVLGDWLPALHATNAWMVSSTASPETAASAAALVTNQSPQMAKINMLVLALGAFPIELGLSLAGIALFLRQIKRQPLRQYLVVLVATFLLFAVVFKGRLPASIVFARYLLPFMVLLLPYAGFVLLRLLSSSQLWRNEAALAACIIILTTIFLDIGRAFNYPAVFPKDAIAAGWTIRRLQESGSMRESGKILIDRRADWGDLGIVALANRPERFVLINELAYQELAAQALPGRRANRAVQDDDNQSVRGSICDQGFQVAACRNSILREGFYLAVLSSPERVRSFQAAFLAPSWIIGDYHIFAMKPLPASAHAAQSGFHKDMILSR